MKNIHDVQDELHYIIIPSPTKLRRDIVTLRYHPSFRDIIVNTLESTSFNGF
jgi:hypothetical protein